MGDEIYMSQELAVVLDKLEIDVNIGIRYCGDEDFYREILAIAYESYLDRFPKLEEYYEATDYKKYTILVHSIKSGAANIGAVKLSDMARALEEAGKIVDSEYINNNHQHFIEYYHRLMKGIADILQLENSSSVVEMGCDEFRDITKDDLREALEKAYYYLEELELDIVEEIIDELLHCKLNSEENELLTSAKAFAGSFCVEGAKEKIQILMGEIS